MLEVRTLGGLSLHVNGKAIRGLGSRKAEALLIYVAASGRPQNRNVIAALLWPDSAEEHALTSLRVALSFLRKSLGDCLDVSREIVRLKPGAQIYLDMSDLQDKLAKGQVEQAMDIYRGDFLQGFHVHGSLEFEDWRRCQQERLHRLVLSALHASVVTAIESRDYRKGLALASWMLELDPLDELAHRRRMLLLALDGLRVPALAQYEKCRDTLQAELGIEPSPETQELYKQILRGIQPTGVEGVIPAHNLPTLQTSFIGREQELARIAGLIADPSCRLLTLVGPGGIGKTRLALQAATKALRSFPDGIYFVSLEAVTSPDYLVPAIANALQLKIDTIATQLDHKYQLLDYLQKRSVLLVLDSFEHLISGAGLLSEILDHAPNVQILVTSRERLNLKVEWTLAVAGLPVPQDAACPTPDDSVALRLFVERANQAKTGFQLSDADREFAIYICQLVEGMPLGIELAAGWTPILSPKEIAQEIQKDLDFLTSSARDLPKKHRSLRAAFDSSWRLLTKYEQDTLCKLSVFIGGFDRQAALQVTGAGLPQLSTLLAKSLLGRNDEGRFYMHALLRQYLAKKLSGSPEVIKDVHNRHCLYYVDFLSQRESDLMGPRMINARGEIRGEMQNVRSAVNWAAVHWEAESARNVISVFLVFYSVQGWQEGRDAFRDIARTRKEFLISRGIPDASRDPIYISALTHQAFLQCNLGLIEESEAISKECLQPLYELQLKEELSECLQNLGVNASFRGEYELAREFLEEAVLLGRDSRHFIWPTYLLWLGHVYFLCGEYKQGMEILQKCYDLFDSRGNIWGKTFALSKMGLAADGLGEYARAIQYHREALSISEQTGDKAGKAYALSRMSMSAYFLEVYIQAIKFGQEGYDIFHDIGHRWGMSTSLCRLGFAFIGLGDRVKARNCFNAALEQSRKNLMTPLSLYSLAGLACLLAQEGETKKAVGLFSYVRRHPQTPSIYVETAARWFVDLDLTLHQDEGATGEIGGKIAAIDDIIESLLG